MARTNAEAEYYRDMIQEQGYVSLDFPISGSAIDPMFEQFRETSSLVWAEDGSGKILDEALRYKVPSREADGSYFLEQRRLGQINPNEPERAPGTDNKDCIHYGPRTKQLAHERLGKRMPAVLSQFLDSCEEIHEATKRTVRPVYRALGIEDMMLARRPENDIHLVRVLRYLGTTASHQADLHFDRAVATMAAWESSPGLVGAPGNNARGISALTPEELEETIDRANASPLDHVSGQGKFFLAAGYNRLPAAVHARNGYLPLLAHGVVNERPEEERDAVVVFMNPHLGIKNYTVPPPQETGLSDVYEHLIERAEIAA